MIAGVEMKSGSKNAVYDKERDIDIAYFVTQLNHRMEGCCILHQWNVRKF
jgi:hypothetical protein